MSGNVWEWVAEGEMSANSSNSVPPMQIAKGGSYDSFADGVRVSERIALPLDHSDIYTGFRVAQ